MKIKPTFLAVIAAAGLAGASASHAATVSISTEAGQDYRTIHGIRDDTATRGGDLIGLQLTATYADGTSENLVWGAIGRSFGVIGSGFELLFRSTDWQLSATSRLASLSMDVSMVDSMFDILHLNDGDTETTKQGFGFEIRDDNIHDGDIAVTYRNQIRYRQDDFQGDAFTHMDVDFTGLFGGGLLGDLAFRTDIDTLRYSGDLTPVPVPGGLPLLASGALLLGLARRARKA